MNQDCSIIVSSCDAYSDAWQPFFLLFFKYWPDCPFEIYLLSETKTYPHPQVIPILLEKDERWATNLRRSLQFIKTPYILYLQEDYLLMKKVDTSRIFQLLNLFKVNHVGYLRLYPAPPPKIPWSVDSTLGVIQKTDDYSVSLQAAFWDKNVFERLLVDGESGWQMEFEGSKRSLNTPEIFLSVLAGQPALDYYCTAIKKGVWFRDAVWLMRREGIKVSSTRPVESLSHYWLRSIGLTPYIDMLKRVNLKKLRSLLR